MDHHDYDIAWILSSPDHHEVATSFFDKHYGQYHSSLLDMTYSTGMVGQLYVVAASKGSAGAPQNMGDVIENLHQEFPSVRAGFLVNPEATAPEKGPVPIGSVVVGTRPNLQSGIIHFDTTETKKQGRLVTTCEPIHIPGAVAMAVEGLLNEEGRKYWSQVLEGRLNRPHLPNLSHQAGHPRVQEKAFRGIIASSTQILDDQILVDRISKENGVLCFDTTAASMKSQSLVVVAGISSYAGKQQSGLSSDEVCNTVISYLSCLTQRIDASKLGLEPSLASLYKYKPFDLKQPGFRLLRLAKGSKNDPIHCQLFQAYLQGKHGREEQNEDGNEQYRNLDAYEALSYCWGERPRLCNMITVDGKTLFITDNLLKALKNLRYDKEDRTLWIDALCIDQSNIQERGHQVGWMTKIYEHAFRVLCWLGDVGRITGSLISLLERFKQEVPPEAWEEWTLDNSEWSKYFQQAQDDCPAYDYPSELRSLLRNPWFSRVWILQEVASARRALIGCSEGWVDAEAFAMAPTALGVQPNSQCQAIIDMMPGPTRRFSPWAQKPNICTLLWRFRESQASDPRDRLYALVGLASDMKAKGRRITADYTKTQEIVVRDITALLFEDTSGTFDQWNIADLQRRIPNLCAIALEKLVLTGAGMKDVQEFIQGKTPVIPLTEAVINYTWCTRSSLMQYFKANPAFQEVVLGDVSRDSEARHIISLARFEEKMKGRVEPTSGTIEALGRNGEDLAHLVSQPDRVDIKITEVVVQHIAKQGRESFLSLLKNRGSEFKITQDTIQILKDNGSDVVQMLKDCPRDKIEITRDLIEEAESQGLESLYLLLDRGRITEDVVEAAARRLGKKVMGLLLDRRGDEVKVTEDVVKAAAGNTLGGGEMIRLLLGRRDAEVKITEDVVKVAVGNTGSGEEILGLLLDRKDAEVKVTEDIVKAAAGNYLSGYVITRLLLDRRGEEIKVTQGILKAATENRGGRNEDLLSLLLDRRGEEFQVTADIWKAAVENGGDSDREIRELLSNRRAKKIEVALTGGGAKD